MQQTNYKLVLMKAAPDNIPLIKLIRGITELDIHSTMPIIKSLPRVIKTNVDIETIKAYIAQIEKLGGIAEIEELDPVDEQDLIYYPTSNLVGSFAVISTESEISKAILAKVFKKLPYVSLKQILPSSNNDSGCIIKDLTNETALTIGFYLLNEGIFVNSKEIIEEKYSVIIKDIDKNFSEIVRLVEGKENPTSLDIFDFRECMPFPVCNKVSKEEAEQMALKLEKLGATIAIVSGDGWKKRYEV